MFLRKVIAMKELFIASKNNHKIKEIKDKLQPLGFHISSLQSVDDEIEIVEDKDSFKGNALKKAETLYRIINKPVLADDSGLVVDALDGAPGIYSARFAGEHATDKENNTLLLERLQRVENRTARFVTAMVLVGLSDQPIVSYGYLEGEIAMKPFGSNGFGYDPIFVVNADKRHLSEYTMEEKNRISHRGKALDELIQYLK